MKDAIFIKPGHVAIEDVAKPEVQAPDDVILHIVRTCVCGSDLWDYRGLDKVPEHSQNGGHEAIGVVEAVGSAITTVTPGDFVIAPFTHAAVTVPPAAQALTQIASAIEITSAKAPRPSTCAINTVSGRWSKFQASQATTAKTC